MVEYIAGLVCGALAGYFITVSLAKKAIMQAFGAGFNMSTEVHGKMFDDLMKQESEREHTQRPGLHTGKDETDSSQVRTEAQRDQADTEGVRSDKTQP